MKRLTLIRHAKSSWKNPYLEDIERPLAKRGKRDAPEMGRRLAATGFAPAIVVSSPARRARKTATRILKAIHRADLVVDERLYMASADEILDLIRGLDDRIDSVAIVGHNPGLTDFCEILSHAGIANIPTMGVVHLDLPVEQWSSVDEGCATLIEFDYPKKSGGSDVRSRK